MRFLLFGAIFYPYTGSFIFERTHDEIFKVLFQDQADILLLLLAAFHHVALKNCKVGSHPEKHIVEILVFKPKMFGQAAKGPYYFSKIPTQQTSSLKEGPTYQISSS